MSNDLVKVKRVLSYTQAVPSDPGFAGTPYIPSRVIKEKVMQRFTAGAETMRIQPVVITGFKTVVGFQWTSPLDVLRVMISEPNLDATDAHYQERLGSWGQEYSDVFLTWLSAVGWDPDARIPTYWTSAWVERMQVRTTMIPAQPAMPPRPPKVGTPARIVYDYQTGWRGLARSVRELPANWIGTVTFDVAKVVGAIVGLIEKPASNDWSSYGLAPVLSGVAVGDGRISPVQRGYKDDSTSKPATALDHVKGVVSSSGVDWFVNDAFLQRTPLSAGRDMVLYASLYQGDDTILNPKITDGLPPDPDIEPGSGKGKLYLPALKAKGSNRGFISAAMTLAPMTVFASDTQIAQGGARLRGLRVLDRPTVRGVARMPAARVRGSDARHDGFGFSVLQRLRTDGFVEREDWVPEYSMGTAAIPPLRVFGTVRGGQAYRMEVKLPALISSASETEHAEGRAVLAPLRTTGEGERLTHLVSCMNFIAQYPLVQEVIYLTLVIAERVGVQAPAVAAAVISVEASEQLGVENVVELSATILEEALEQIGTSVKHTALLFRLQGDQIIPVEQGSAWAVNTATNASTRYEGYAFNSFMVIGGKHFGVQPRGVYLLEGKDDAGLPIAAGVNLGKQDFGSQALKGLSAVHAGVSATGTLFLRVGDGHNTWTYRARRVDPRLRTQRFDPGKGLRTNYFDFELVSEGEFELDSVRFEVVASQRRI